METGSGVHSLLAHCRDQIIYTKHDRSLFYFKAVFHFKYEKLI